MGFSRSYYPECKRKFVLYRLMENVIWVLKNHRANIFYTLYGLDIKGHSSKEFIDEKKFWRGLDKVNYKKGVNSQVCLLRDKFLFFKYMQANSIPVPEVFGIVRNGKLYDMDFKEQPLNAIKNEKDYFIKDVDGQCASFVKHIESFENYLNIQNEMDKGIYILQRSIQQVKKMNELNSYAINTLRIVTVYCNGKPKVLSALLRVGTSKTGNVDNWAAGGFAIGIQDNGYLKKYGLYKPGHGLKAEMHPDSGIVFENFEIPMLNEAYEMACNAHNFFYGVGAIGWDIAITCEGPVIIEGNDNFEITLMQACDRPLKREWLQTI